MKTIYRYYPESLYNIYKDMDPLARRRDADADKRSNLICAVCGNVELFYINVKIRVQISNASGKIDVVPSKRVIDINSMIRTYMETGNCLSAICAKCGGPVVLRSVAKEICANHRCGGCVLCGQYSIFDELMKSRDGLFDFTRLWRNYDYYVSTQ